MVTQHLDLKVLKEEGPEQREPHSLNDRRSDPVRRARDRRQFTPAEEPPSVRDLPRQQKSFAAHVYRDLVKRTIDIAAAGAMLLALTPILVFITIIIRRQYGAPVMFRQERIGKNGHPFTIYKFRTMLPDRRQTSLQIMFAERRKTLKSAKDPRVTSFGKFLRETSLDELPQLINVLKGDMSLVGPRPELSSIVARYATWQFERLSVTPGITGWWQVEGRGAQPMYEHVDLDIYYVRRQSIWLDLKILLRTIGVVLSRSGAF